MTENSILGRDFFDADACDLAAALLGKIIRHRQGSLWLSARIVETEAYYRCERGSHASLGLSPSRRALFMPAGTIYMYYARGGDSFNISAAGAGDAVLIKAGLAHQDSRSGPDSIRRMQALNPRRNGEQRPLSRLCAGQTLLCKALNLKVTDWDRHGFDPARLYVEDCAIAVPSIIRTTRLGIPRGRDEHLPYRFIDASLAGASTRNPLTRRGARAGQDYELVANPDRRRA